MLEHFMGNLALEQIMEVQDKGNELKPKFELLHISNFFSIHSYAFEFLRQMI